MRPFIEKCKHLPIHRQDSVRRSRFGQEHGVPLLKGLDFNESEISRAMEKNIMLLLDLDMSFICDLNCIYCDRQLMKDVSKKSELSVDERLSAIDQARQLGCKTIQFIGAGEPLLDPVFWDVLETVAAKGITPIIFTNGTTLNEETAEKLRTKNASIILKYNSRKPELQDRLAGKRGYSVLCERALKTLIAAGFNAGTPTRLGLNMVILRENKEEVLGLLDFCRENNIFPQINAPLPVGNMLNMAEQMLNKEELLELFDDGNKRDAKKHGISYDPILPFLGGFKCQQIVYGLFVNIIGNAFACNSGYHKLGNIKENMLAKIWFSEEATRIRKSTISGRCPIREDYWAIESDENFHSQFCFG